MSVETVSVLGSLVRQIHAVSHQPTLLYDGIKAVYSVILPPRTLYPAMCVTYERTIFGFTTEDEHYEQCYFNVLCYAVSGEVAESLLRQTISGIRDQNLTALIVGFTVQVFPEDLFTRATVQRGPGGEEMVEGVLRLRVDVQRNQYPTGLSLRS